MTMQVFIRNPDSGEPWAYCGPYGALDTRNAIGHYITSELWDSFGDTVPADVVKGGVALQFKFAEMMSTIMSDLGCEIAPVCNPTTSFREATA